MARGDIPKISDAASTSFLGCEEQSIQNFLGCRQKTYVMVPSEHFHSFGPLQQQVQLLSTQGKLWANYRQSSSRSITSPLPSYSSWFLFHPREDCSFVTLRWFITSQIPGYSREHKTAVSPSRVYSQPPPLLFTIQVSMNSTSSAPKSYPLSDLLQFILKIGIRLLSLSCDVSGISCHSQFHHGSQRSLKSKQNI